MHDVRHPSSSIPVFGTNQNKNKASDDSAFMFPTFGLKGDFKELFDFAELNSKMTNSTQTFNRMNSLQLQVNSLQQQVASYGRNFSDLYSHYWILPNSSIKGISGYVCEKCKTLSCKAIFDPGYDMTMQSKHSCLNISESEGHVVLQIPPETQNIDDWAGRILLDCVNNHTGIGRNLLAKDMTKGLRQFARALDPGTAFEMFGIPDRYAIYQIEKDNNIRWVQEAISNLDKRIGLSDSEILDFLSRFKSTYAIMQIRTEIGIQHISMILTK
jgi:hypothetical protein